MKTAAALDNPIFASLRTRHERFALAAGPARRFIPEVGPLSGFEGEGASALRALKAVTAPGGTAGFFLEAPFSPPSGWEKIMERPLLQMVHDGRELPAPDPAPLDLGPADAPEMLALATLTKPGPFSTRTHELGGFVGVREGGRLAAMAGERLKLPGWTEVSAVCAHPEHLGRGHAARAMTVVIRRILARGERPFLGVLPENARAIALYERLGFSERRRFTYAAYRRAAQ